MIYLYTYFYYNFLINLSSINLSFLTINEWKLPVLVFIFFIFLILKNIKNLEELVLHFTVLLGSSIIICTNHLFILYLSLELQTFSLFILISKNKLWLKSSEAGLKYFILGAISSGFLLLSFIIIYYYTSSLNIKIINFNFWYNDITLNLALFILILSLFFKISLSPLHFWIPDIYEGSSWKTIGFLGILSKISVIYFLIQLKETNNLFIFCSILSIIIGTLGALNQTKVKRLLAYSGITHIGFIILILSIYNNKGFLISNIYLLIYFISFLSIILILQSYHMSNNNYIIELGNIQYLNKVLAISFLIITLSMAGVPPLSGFISKWLVLWIIIEEGYLLSALICIFFSVIGAVYYLRLVKIVYFQKESSFIHWKNIFDSKTNINYYFIGFSIFVLVLLIVKPNFIFSFLILKSNLLI